MEIIKWTEYASAIASMVSATLSALSLGGIYFAWKQFKHSKDLAQLQFEDSMGKEYRDLVNKIPTKALLGEDLNEDEFSKVFDDLYRYFDLTNHQILLRFTGRVSENVWSEWQKGIKYNMEELPVFVKAWRIVKEKTTIFTELRSLEATGYNSDPFVKKMDRMIL